MKKDKTRREDFEEHSFEVKSGGWFEKLVRLALWIWFLQKLGFIF